MYGVGLLAVQATVGALDTAAAIADPAMGAWLRQIVVTPLVQSFTAMVGAAGVASIYFELRTIKEGIGIEALAAAFD